MLLDCILKLYLFIHSTMDWSHLQLSYAKEDQWIWSILRSAISIELWKIGRGHEIERKCLFEFLLHLTSHLARSLLDYENSVTHEIDKKKSTRAYYLVLHVPINDLSRVKTFCYQISGNSHAGCSILAECSNWLSLHFWHHFQTWILLLYMSICVFHKKLSFFRVAQILTICIVVSDSYYKCVIINHVHFPADFC